MVLNAGEGGCERWIDLPQQASCRRRWRGKDYSRSRFDSLGVLHSKLRVFLAAVLSNAAHFPARHHLSALQPRFDIAHQLAEPVPQSHEQWLRLRSSASRLCHCLSLGARMREPAPEVAVFLLHRYELWQHGARAEGVHVRAIDRREQWLGQALQHFAAEALCDEV